MNPTTREEMFMAAAGGEEITLPKPITRREMFLAKAAGEEIELPEPITREEMFLQKIAEGGGGDLKITNASYLFAYLNDQAVVDVLASLVVDCTDVVGAFENYKLPELPFFDTSKCESFESTFSSCGAATIPLFDMSSNKSLVNAFRTSGIVEIPEIDTSCVNKFDYAFQDCSKLETVARLDVGALTSDTFSKMFYGCKALKNLYLYNIKRNIVIGSGTTWGHLLSVDSLVHTIKELHASTANRTLTIGSANLEKIAGLYCKIIDDTTEKKPMELCESTDEGAMTLQDYALTKKWSIQ